MGNDLESLKDAVEEIFQKVEQKDQRNEREMIPKTGPGQELHFQMLGLPQENRENREE